MLPLTNTKKGTKHCKHWRRKKMRHSQLIQCWKEKHSWEALWKNIFCLYSTLTNSGTQSLLWMFIKFCIKRAALPDITDPVSSLWNAWNKGCSHIVCIFGIYTDTVDSTWNWDMGRWVGLFGVTLGAAFRGRERKSGHKMGSVALLAHPRADMDSAHPWEPANSPQ